MRIGLVVDSGCDLPMDFLADHGVVLLPIALRLDEDALVDNHDVDAAMEFYRNEIGRRGVSAQSQAPGVDEITQLFLNRLVGEFDYVFCQTMMRSRSQLFENATKASFRILSEYRPPREEAGDRSPFAMRVTDTGTVFSGQGIIAAETARLIRNGVAAGEVRQRVKGMIESVRAYAVPQDTYYVRARGRLKGDRSVGWLSALLASTLDIKPVLTARNNRTEVVARIRGFDAAAERVIANLRRAVEWGLDAPYVVLSYAGDLELMRMLPGYSELQDLCARQNVTMLESVMSVTGGIHLGPGTFSAAVLAKQHEFQ